MFVCYSGTLTILYKENWRSVPASPRWGIEGLGLAKHQVQPGSPTLPATLGKLGISSKTNAMPMQVQF